MARDHKVILDRIDQKLSGVLSEQSINNKDLKIDANLLLQSVKALSAALEEMRSEPFKHANTSTEAPAEFIELCEENYDLYAEFIKQYSLGSSMEVCYE